MFEKVRTKKVYMEIVEQIQNLIKEGKLKPSDKLPPERILADKLGVSRPPLREAISALEILGIIESRGGKGTFIKNIFNPTSYAQRLKELEKEESPFELLEARKAVETEIAQLAAKKATKEDIAAIQESLDKMKGTVNVPEIMQFDREFHLNVAKGAHNSPLLSIMTYLADGLKEDLWVKLKGKSWSISRHKQNYLAEHTKIFNAIKDKDRKKAYETMHNHLATVEELLLSE